MNTYKSKLIDTAYTFSNSQRAYNSLFWGAVMIELEKIVYPKMHAMIAAKTMTHEEFYVIDRNIRHASYLRTVPGKTTSDRREYVLMIGMLRGLGLSWKEIYKKLKIT